MTSQLQVPRRVMIDTGVFLRWLDKAKDGESPACFEVVEHVLNNGGNVLFAAPSVAEVLRWGHASTIPRRRGFTVVAFDELAARELAMKLLLPRSVIEGAARRLADAHHERGVDVAESMMAIAA